MTSVCGSGAGRWRQGSPTGRPLANTLKVSSRPGVVGEHDDGGGGRDGDATQVGDVQRATLPKDEAAAVPLLRRDLPPEGQNINSRKCRPPYSSAVKHIGSGA